MKDIPTDLYQLQSVGFTCGFDSLVLSYISFKDAKINRTETIYAGTAAATTLNLQGDVGGSAVVISTGARWSF